MPKKTLPKLSWAIKGRVKRTLLAGRHARGFKIPRIQVIGSAGKTTTKEMIGAVLSQKYEVLIGRTNRNSPRGVAQNLRRLKKTHDVAVLEAGMKSFGIMRMSTRMIRPTIAVVTSIQRAHRARFSSMGSIIKAKAEMLQYLSKNGTLIVNDYEKYSRKFPLHKYKGKVIRFGFSDQCDIWASDIVRKGFTTHFLVHIGSQQFPCTINIIGKYNVGNALAAAAVGLELGLSAEEISRGLANFSPIWGRLKVYRLRNGATIIDDSFNANPDSTRMLTKELIEMCKEYRVVLVIGDMERPSLKVGKYARQVHYQIGQQIARGNFAHVLTVGFWAKEYARGAVQAGFPPDRICHYKTVQAAVRIFEEMLTPETIAVLKASPYVPLKKLRLNMILV